MLKININMSNDKHFLELYKNEILKAKIEILYQISKQKEVIESGESFIQLMREFLPEAIQYKDLYSDKMRQIMIEKMKKKKMKKKNMKKKMKKKKIK